MLAAAAVHDAAACDLRAPNVALTGLRILSLLTQAAVNPNREQERVHATLARAWNVGARGVDLVRGALVSCRS